MEIIDDFLTDQEFSRLEETFLGEYFPWYYNSYTRDVEDAGLANYRLVHALYRPTGEMSNWFEVLEPLWDKINPKTIVRAKLNLGPRDSEQREMGWHVDIEDPEVTTAVFFLNTNNGYTLFEDGSRVDSVRNRFASFPSGTQHTGITHTDAQVRVVLNLNYIA